jgi:hypothetical protein
MVERALSYPYDVPREAYVLIDGRVCGFDADGRVLAPDRVAGHGVGEPLAKLLAVAGEPLHERIPVLGYGSNAAPSQLRRKFADAGPGCVIPVLKARLRGFDVVYSAHVSVYGAIPATLCPRPGTTVDGVVTLLSPRQAETMLRTEGGNYSVEAVDSRIIESAFEFGNAPQVYVSKYGALALEGQPVALSAVPASGRSLAELSEAQMLERVVAELEPSLGVEEFIVECNRSEDARTGWVERLGQWALSCHEHDLVRQ